MLHISQSTISRDIHHMQSKISNKDLDPDVQLLDEYHNSRIILKEAIKELWKIIDSPKTSSKDKNKSINLILSITKECRLLLEKEIGLIHSKKIDNLYGNRLF
jgi:hypothetical protein